MRIAVNVRFLLKDRLEGIGWYTHEVVRRLVERHPEHEFIFFFDRPYDPAFVFGSNVTPVVAYPPARHYLLWWWWYEMMLPYLLKKYGADVFFSPDGYCSLRSKVPTVMVTHDIAHVHYPCQIPAWARHYYHRYVPLYLQRAEQVITVSEFVKQDITQHYHIPVEKITVAGNGVKTIFQPITEVQQTTIRAKYSNGKPYFFYIGAIHPRKNVERLIRAFDLFRSQYPSDMQLLIGGRLAWQSDSMKQVWQEAIYKNDIHGLGYIPEERLPGVLGSALALTYISLFEGFGVPLLEAMQAEVPVITSNVSSLPEVAGDAALLVDPTSEAEIARAMQEIATKPRLREELVEKGSIQRSKYSWERTADIIWDILSKVNIS
ncbi:MAG: glycosyltransferase family 4 protein [Lewinella sp.]|nr:glycosyltransferase family 4 protein [Lewinella sp.]